MPPPVDAPGKILLTLGCSACASTVQVTVNAVIDADGDLAFSLCQIRWFIDAHRMPSYAVRGRA